MLNKMGDHLGVGGLLVVRGPPFKKHWPTWPHKQLCDHRFNKENGKHIYSELIKNTPYKQGCLAVSLLLQLSMGSKEHYITATDSLHSTIGGGNVPSFTEHLQANWEVDSPASCFQWRIQGLWTSWSSPVSIAWFCHSICCVGNVTQILNNGIVKTNAIRQINHCMVQACCVSQHKPFKDRLGLDWQYRICTKWKNQATQVGKIHFLFWYKW